jgi:hypothetical protein
MEHRNEIVDELWQLDGLLGQANIEIARLKAERAPSS